MIFAYDDTHRIGIGSRKSVIFTPQIVVLEQVSEPLVAPSERFVALQGFLGHWCRNVGVNVMHNGGNPSDKSIGYCDCVRVRMGFSLALILSLNKLPSMTAKLFIKIQG